MLAADVAIVDAGYCYSTYLYLPAVACVVMSGAHPWCLGSFPGDHCSATMLNSLDVFLMLCAADGPTMFSLMAKLKGPRSPDVTRHS